MIVNTSKSNVIIFTYIPFLIKTTKENIELRSYLSKCIHKCCEKIRILNSVKYLGLYIDSDLKWHKHTDEQSKKIRKIHYTVYHMRQLITAKLLRIVYLSWLRSTLKYGIVFWEGTNIIITEPIKTLQKPASKTKCKEIKKRCSVHILLLTEQCNLLIT